MRSIQFKLNIMLRNLKKMDNMLEVRVLPVQPTSEEECSSALHGQRTFLNNIRLPKRSTRECRGLCDCIDGVHPGRRMIF